MTSINKIAIFKITQANFSRKKAFRYAKWLKNNLQRSKNLTNYMTTLILQKRKNAE
jgi:hypothetical protein